VTTWPAGGPVSTTARTVILLSSSLLPQRIARERGKEQRNAVGTNTREKEADLSTRKEEADMAREKRR